MNRPRGEGGYCYGGNIGEAVECYRRLRRSREVMNSMFDLMKKRKYKLIPKDAQIHRISDWDVVFDGYIFIITSKEFPLVEEGRECSEGDIKIYKEKGVIELKEKI